MQNKLMLNCTYLHAYINTYVVHIAANVPCIHMAAVTVDTSHFPPIPLLKHSRYVCMYVCMYIRLFVCMYIPTYHHKMCMHMLPRAFLQVIYVHVATVSAAAVCTVLYVRTHSLPCPQPVSEV